MTVGTPLIVPRDVSAGQISGSVGKHQTRVPGEDRVDAGTWADTPPRSHRHARHARQARVHQRHDEVTPWRAWWGRRAASTMSIANTWPRGWRGPTA
jgi:hypothetical protein